MVINDGERISRAESDYKKLPPLYSSDREIKHPPFQETFLFDLKRKKENKVLARTRGRKRKEYHLLGSFISNNCARFDFPLIIIPPGIPLEPFVQSHPPKLYRLIELRHQLQIQPRNNQFERRANVEQVWGGGEWAQIRGKRFPENLVWPWWSSRILSKREEGACRKVLNVAPPAVTTSKYLCLVTEPCLT